MKKLVIIPGGFHPFHGGHMSLYNAAKQAFPSADVFIAATADTSTRPFPFELKKMLAQAAGVPGERFIQVKSPFRAEEITQMYDPKNTQLIFVRSQKDMDELPRPGGVKKDGSPTYLQPYKRNGLESFDRHGYMAYLPTVQFGPGMTSATEIRAKWPKMSARKKVALVKNLYPNASVSAAKKAVEIFDKVLGGEVEEGIGKALATAALAGSMALSTPAVAQSPSDANTRAVVTIDGQQKVFDMGKLDVRKAADMLEKSLESKGVTNYKASVSDGRQRMNIDRTGAVVDRTNEAGLPGTQASLMGSPAGVGAGGLQPTNLEMPNGPDREPRAERNGLAYEEQRITPAGGLGSYTSDALKSNLIMSLRCLADYLKVGNYQGVYHILYQDPVFKTKLAAIRDATQDDVTEAGDYVSET